MIKAIIRNMAIVPLHQNPKDLCCATPTSPRDQFLVRHLRSRPNGSHPVHPFFPSSLLPFFPLSALFDDSGRPQVPRQTRYFSGRCNTVDCTSERLTLTTVLHR